MLVWLGKKRVCFMFTLEHDNYSITKNPKSWKAYYTSFAPQNEEVSTQIAQHNALKKKDDHARSACPSRNAKRARTSVTYCKPSSKGTRCKRSLSVGSLIQPSIGMALSNELGQRQGHSVKRKAGPRSDSPSWNI